MARNGSGTYTVPNSFTPSTTITSADVNENFTDIGNEITNSVAVDGQSTMTGALKAANGAVGTPSVTFGSDTDTGIFRKGANQLAIAAGGSEVANFSSSGLTLATGLATANIADNAVTYAKIQNVSATDKILGRSTSGAGNVEEITCTAAGRAVLDDADAAAQRTTLGLGSLAVKSSVATGDLASGFGAIDLQAPVFSSTNANTSINAVIPIDSTIPKDSEGTQILSASITPKSTTSKIVIDILVQGGAGNNNSITIALFKASGADAVAASIPIQFANGTGTMATLHYEEVSGTTSSVTWNVRVGGIFTLNTTNGTNTLGGVVTSWIRIREIGSF
jgi:hypothetical protein